MHPRLGHNPLVEPAGGDPSVTLAPFEINVSADILEDLRVRLLRTRFGEPTPGPAWQAGTDPAYLRGLVAYWASGFDWRARERELNDVTHGLADVHGTTIHFVHVRGNPAPGQGLPLPLVLSHGWPSSFVEMLPLVPLLTDPASHGGEVADTFDV